MRLEHPLTPTKLCRTTDPDTSFDAACNAGRFAERHHDLILVSLREVGPGGAEQIADRIGLDPYQVRKRTAELERKKKIRVVQGEQRRTRSGRSERVWEIAA